MPQRENFRRREFAPFLQVHRGCRKAIAGLPECRLHTRMWGTSNLPPITAPGPGRLPPISSLLGLPQADREADFAHAPAAPMLPQGTMRTLVSEPMLPAAGGPPELGPWAPTEPSNQFVMECLLLALHNEQLKTQALQTQMMMVQGNMYCAFDANGRGDSGHEEVFGFAGEKRRMSFEHEPTGMLTQRRKRVHVRTACHSCKNSHIACDDRQPCRNCVRRGCRCERPLNSAKVPAVGGDRQRVVPKAAEGQDSMRCSTSRKYVKTACSCCHRSHLACDEVRPCRNCVRLGLQGECLAESKRTEGCEKASRASTAAASPCDPPGSPADNLTPEAPLGKTLKGV